MPPDALSRMRCDAAGVELHERTPVLLLQELAALGQLAGPRSLRGLPVVVTHLKPAPGNETLIWQQLAAGNVLGVKLILPEQGRALQF